MASYSKDDLHKFTLALEDKRDRLLVEAKRTLEHDMVIEVEERFDEVDQASNERMQAFSFRLRGRERHLLDKIEIALRKIKEGGYGDCEGCGEEISRARLEARPEAQLCIQCKEEQEKEESVYTG
jgi:DnaK suppressor protein